MRWYVVCLCIQRGHSLKRVRHIESRAESAPELNREKAIALTGIGILVGGGLSALLIAVFSIVIVFILCILYGLGVAFAGL